MANPIGRAFQLCQNGAVKEAFKSASLQLRKTAVMPPSLTVDQMKGVVAGAQRAASQQAELTAATAQELQGASAPPVLSRSGSGAASDSGRERKRSSGKVQAV